MSPGTPAGLAAVARGMALDAHAVGVISALGAADIEPVLLKGPGLAQRLYADDPLRRRYSDVDLLVAPAEFDRAQEVLAGLGHIDVAAAFPADEWLSHERSWRDDATGLTVDLHRGFAGVDDPEALHRLLLEHAEPLVLDGIVVQVPDATGCALLLALHAAAPGRGRKALVDLTHGLEQLSAATWAGAGRWASATRSSEAFATGLRRTAAGAVLADQLALSVSPSLLSRTAERLDLVLLHQSLHAVRRVPGPWAKLAYTTRRLVPTPGFLRDADPVAQEGLLGLAAAYASRPLRLLQPAPRDTSSTRPGPTPLALDPRRWTQSTLVTAAWTWRTLARTRRQVSERPFDEVTLPTAPPRAADAEPTVRRVLHRRGATCLERALVLQRWRAGQGAPSELVIGVTTPTSGFRAHAWLADDRDAEHHGSTMTEMLRRRTPEAWLRRG